MTPERWARIRQIFEDAIPRSVESRARFLDQACGGDQELHREVQSLLALHRSGSAFLEGAAWDDPSIKKMVETLAESGGRFTGQTLSHYEVMELVGTGGMGEVYRGRDLKLGRMVALKFLRGTDLSPAAHDRFRQEAQAVSRLNHPNVATIYEMGEEDDAMFLALEFLDGGSLRQRIRTGIPPGQALAIAAALARGLDHAHSRGILHRDIKPANIMFDSAGNPKITDFGLSRFVSSPHITRVGTRLGTALYMSPEQARGEETDARTDVFSLGVVLYEMLAGCPPFEGESEAAVYKAIVEKEPPPPAGASPETWRTLARALAKDRQERFQTAREFADAIDSLQGKVRAHGRFSWTKRAGVAALLACLAGGVIWQRTTPLRQTGARAGNTVLASRQPAPEASVTEAPATKQVTKREAVQEIQPAIKPAASPTPLPAAAAPSPPPLPSWETMQTTIRKSWKESSPAESILTIEKDGAPQYKTQDDGYYLVQGVRVSVARANGSIGRFHILLSFRRSPYGWDFAGMGTLVE